MPLWECRTYPKSGSSTFVMGNNFRKRQNGTDARCREVPPNGTGGEESQAWNATTANDADGLIRLYSYSFGVNCAGAPMAVKRMAQKLPIAGAEYRAGSYCCKRRAYRMKLLPTRNVEEAVFFFWPTN